MTENDIRFENATSAGDWLAFSLPVQQANKIFDANFSIYKHVASGKDLIRTLTYSVPIFLQEHINLIHPTTTSVVIPATYSFSLTSYAPWQFCHCTSLRTTNSSCE